MTRRASKSELNRTQTLINKRQKTRESMQNFEKLIKKNKSSRKETLSKMM